MNVELRIEELVLHGFPPGNDSLISVAAERELARLFAERGVPAALARGANASHLDAGAFEIKAGQRTETIGAQVAWSLYEGLVSRDDNYRREERSVRPAQ